MSKTCRVDYGWAGSGIKHLEVRLINPEEQEQWDELMRRHHYMGFHSIVGEALKYAAILEGRWVGLIGWGTAAFKSRHRDAWIGWEPPQQWRRLKFLANNVRFLILPGDRIPNLASKILGMNLKRLSDDWRQAHGHPIVMAETFVDTSRFQGTCYKAAGWLPLGETRGFRRNGGKYYHHGNKKMHFIRPLRKDAACLLKDPWLNPKLFNEEGLMDINTINIDDSGGLIEYLRRIPEPRMARGIRHNRISVLAVAICAILSGAKTFAAIGEWAARASQSMLRRFGCRWNRMEKIYEAPSEPTIRRLLQQIDAAAVDRELGDWLLSHLDNTVEQAIAIDGKTLRGSKVQSGKQTHLMSAFLYHQGVVIAQTQVDDKSNEITAVRPMFEKMDIRGMVVTADAMHTQKDTATFLVKEKKADYFFTVKDNQATLKSDIEALHLEAFPPSA